MFELVLYNLYLTLHFNLCLCLFLCLCLYLYQYLVFKNISKFGHVPVRRGKGKSETGKSRRCRNRSEQVKKASRSPLPDQHDDDVGDAGDVGEAGDAGDVGDDVGVGGVVMMTPPFHHHSTS